MASHWGQYKNISTKKKYDNSINGHIFEYLIGVLFLREGIKPLFLGAKVAFVPNVIFDFMLYEKGKGPICMSAKTTLRERYKQADLEAFALKNVHRNARSYLVTFNSEEAARLRKKIASGDALGLHDIICADTQEFDDLIADLHRKDFIQPQKIEIITSTSILA